MMPKPNDLDPDDLKPEDKTTLSDKHDASLHPCTSKLDTSLRQNQATTGDMADKLSTSDCFGVDWPDHFTETRLTSFIEDGFVVLEQVFSPAALTALQAESGFIDYRDAKIAEGLRLSSIRGDRIRWIDDQCWAGYRYLLQIKSLAGYFNQTLFTGIRHSEAHYACYPIGFGYQWHTDNPAHRDERVISAVFYLNDEWTQADGGALALIDHHGMNHQILPKANRLVIFDSNLRHQVEIAHRERFSIATWLRRDDPVIGA